MSGKKIFNGYCWLPTHQDINPEFNEYLEYHVHCLQQKGLKKILVVEDDPMSFHIIQKIIQDFDPEARCFFAQTEEDALHIAKTVRCDLAIVDYFLEGHTGLELCNRLSVENPPMKYAIISSLRRHQYQEILKYSKAIPEFFEKPLSVKEIKKYLSTAFENGYSP